MFTTMTSKGQLTVPKIVRDKLNLRPGDKIDFIFDENDNCKMIPVRSSVKDMKGMLRPSPKNISIDDMNAAIQKEVLNHDRH